MSRWQTAARTLQEGSLAALLFLLPFSNAAVELGFGILFIAWLAERAHPQTRADTVWRSPRLRPLRWALIAFLAVCALSILVSTHPSKSLQGFINKWVEYILLLVIVADVARRPGTCRRMGVVLAVSSLFVVIEALTQERLGRGLFRHIPLSVYSRMTGPYRNPIDLATYLMVVIPILLALSVRCRPWGRWLLRVLVVLLVVCFARTEASGAWLGLIAGFAVISLRHPALRRAALVLLTGFALVAGLILWRVGRFEQTLSGSDVGTRDRLVMWQAALRMIRDRPILGHGVNTFMANYLAYRVGGERQPRYAHNCYLQMAAETGLIGLLAFLAVLGLLLARISRGVRRAAPDARVLLTGLLVGLSAFVIHAAVDTDFYSLRQVALFWILSGVALGSGEGAAPTTDQAG